MPSFTTSPLCYCISLVIITIFVLAAASGTIVAAGAGGAGVAGAGGLGAGGLGAAGILAQTFLPPLGKRNMYH